jgi:hypothetical protein
MLKRLAILAVILAVAQAPVPIPGQTTNHSAGNGGAIQQQSGKGKTPTQPTASLASQNQPAPAKGNAGDQGTKEDGNTVAVSKLPTVSISKDWADKSYWGFSGLLVVVGGFQVWLLWHTLRAIKRQANTMDVQATEAKKSSAETLAAIKEQNDNLLISAKAATVMAMASNKSAKAALAQIEMMKDKERARVEIKTFGLELQRVGEEFWHIKTTIELRNVGEGRAYIRLGMGSIEVVGDGIPEPYSKSVDILESTEIFI